MIKIKTASPLSVEQLIDSAKVEGWVELSKYKSPMCFPDEAPQILTDTVIKHCSPRQISSYLNENLVKMGIKTTTMKDYAVGLDQETLEKVLRVACGEGSENGINMVEITNIANLMDSAKRNNIPIILKLDGIREKYWMLKQYGSHALAGWHVLQMSRVSSIAAAASSTGVAAFTVGSGIAISFSGVVFLALIENHMPAGPVKNVLKGARYLTGIPVMNIEYFSNAAFGLGESLIFGQQLPTNITSTYRILDGPELDKLPGLQTILAQWFISVGKKLGASDK